MLRSLVNQTWQGFYAIVDPEHCVLSALETADAILMARPAALQLRWKNGSDRDRFALGTELRKRCNVAAVPFVMNDRFDLALLTGADGLHLGQDDLPIEEARRFFSGPIGVSTHTMAQAKAVQGADLIGFGPVFDTSSKANPDATVGLRGLASICAAVEVPVVAWRVHGRRDLRRVLGQGSLRGDAALRRRRGEALIIEIAVGAAATAAAAYILRRIRNRRAPPPQPEGPPKPKGPRGLCVGDVLLYASDELWLSAMIELREEGEFVARLFKTPGSEHADWVVQLDPEAKDLALLKDTDVLPAGRVPAELRVQGILHHLLKRGTATLRAEGEALRVAASGEFTILSGTAGRVLVFVDGSGDKRIAGAGERVPAEMLDFLPGD